jgi:hypothetical protein
MKRFLIFLLAAGPFLARGQRADQLRFDQLHVGQPLRLPSFQFSVGKTEPVLRLKSDASFVRPWVRIPDAAIRLMAPDGMACLVPLRGAEPMPISRRGNADPLPNALPRR